MQKREREGGDARRDDVRYSLSYVLFDQLSSPRKRPLETQEEKGFPENPHRFCRFSRIVGGAACKERAHFLSVRLSRANARSK